MRSNAWPERAFAVLVACSMEAAWLELAYVTAQGITGRPVAIPLLAFALAALVGLAFGRWATRHPGIPYRTVLAALVVAAAVVGWLVPLGPAAAGLLAEPMATLELHLAGLLLGVAVRARRGPHHARRRRAHRAGRAGPWPRRGRRAVAAAHRERRRPGRPRSSRPRSRRP